MKKFITSSVAALLVLCGTMLISQAAAPESFPQANQSLPYGQPFQNTAYSYPAYGTQYMPQHVTSTQMRTGYTRGEIRSMPITARPNRFGHFIGNTVRRRAGTGF